MHNEDCVHLHVHVHVRSMCGSDPGSCSPQVEIESGRLLFRRDLSPVADVGLRQDLLDMLLLNYSPVWLRIGLEVCTLHCTCMDIIHVHVNVH